MSSELVKKQTSGRVSVDAGAGPICPDSEKNSCVVKWLHEHFFGSDVKLEKLGNCKTLMTLKKLKIESADYGGYGHWSVHLQDPSEKKDYGYYYGYSANADYGVDLTSCEKGSVCIVAFIGDLPVVVVGVVN